MRLEEFLEQNTQKAHLSKGDVIFIQGDQAKSAYYVIRGKIEIFKTMDGKESIVAHLGADEIFGEMSLLRFDEYTLSARALEDTDVYLITPEVLQAQIRETHPLIKAILDMLLDRINDTNKVLIDLDKINMS
ncbi:MAG: cyclic nucleotide-binding domain-containing protein [Alphaproteobacteria bacterium]|nr:cyclic nucleotide-binding domain-containing protein [Alphaproteobacteria bacterium]